MAMDDPVKPSGSRLLKVLPEVFQVAADTSPAMRALMAVAEDMQGPVREVLDRIHTVPDPRRAPASLIPFLSHWVDLDWLTLPDPGTATVTLSMLSLCFGAGSFIGCSAETIATTVSRSR